jgi:hypothetical protein
MEVGGDFDEDVTVREVVAGKTVFFRAEDESDAAVAGQLLGNEWSKIGELNNGLLGLAIGEGSSAHHERAMGDGLGKALRALRVLEKFWCSYCGACLTPHGRERSDNRETLKAEVGHGAGCRTYIKGVARGDEHHVEPLALGFSEHVMIVERRTVSGQSRIEPWPFSLQPVNGEPTSSPAF